MANPVLADRGSAHHIFGMHPYIAAQGQKRESSSGTACGPLLEAVGVGERSTSQSWFALAALGLFRIKQKEEAGKY